VPRETNVTVVPETVQTLPVAEAKVTLNPDDEVALTVNGEALNNLLVIVLKVMVCAVPEIVSVLVRSDAAR
jgi:hypothetical protein